MYPRPRVRPFIRTSFLARDSTRPVVFPALDRDPTARSDPPPKKRTHELTATADASIMKQSK